MHVANFIPIFATHQSKRTPIEIKLIKRELKNGRTSLVLEYYLGYTLGANGTTRPKRKFETLEYFLYTAPRNKAERDHNKINLEMAEKVKAKRLLAEQNEQYGFAVPFKIRTNLVEFIRGMVEQRKDSPGNWGNWDSMLKHLIAYAGTETTFERIDRRFVEGFRTYLAKEARTKSGTALSVNSQNSYFLKFKAALNRAVEEGIVPQSPAMGVKATRTEDVHREYLTIEELQRLVKTDCSYPVLKDAFIFSCLTGMRWSDINKLTWGEVQEFDGGTRVVFRQKKTRGLEYLDIAGQAVRYMGPARQGRRTGLHGAEILRLAQPRAARMVHEGGHHEAYHLPLRAPHLRRIAALIGHRNLHPLEAPRPPRAEDHAGLCADYGREETRSGEPDSGIMIIFEKRGISLHPCTATDRP